MFNTTREKRENGILKVNSKNELKISKIIIQTPICIIYLQKSYNTI